MIDPHKTKYHNLYWSMVEAAAAQSVANRAQVGAIVVTPTGMLSVGWNGSPPGMPNNCEYLPEDAKGYDTGRTKPETIHAERNALDKMARQGVPVAGSVLFVSHAPCIECAKSIHGLGFKAVYYRQPYKNDDGVKLLESIGIPIHQVFKEERYAVKPTTVDTRLIDPRGPGFTARNL